MITVPVVLAISVSLVLISRSAVDVFSSAYMREYMCESLYMS